MATTVLPAFFGMNLDSGLAGDDPRFFVLVSLWCLPLCVRNNSTAWLDCRCVETGYWHAVLVGTSQSACVL